MSVRTIDGRYVVDVRWPDGVRTRSWMPDEKTAGRISKKIEVAVVDEERIWRKLRKELRLEQNQIASFADLADRYLNEYVKVENRDIRNKGNRLDVLKEFFKGRSVDALNYQEISRFKAAKKQEGVKNATINRYLALLRHMARWATKQQIFEFNPIPELEKLKEAEWVGIRPDDALIDAIFGRLDARVLPIFAFMRDTGCRENEAMTLTSPQIDFANQEVVFHTNTKSGKSRRVPITDKGLWAVQALPKLGATVFYHPGYLKPWDGDGLRVFWDKARGSISLRIHDLRHAYAIKLAEEGCAMHFISAVLGHHSVAFTESRYARFSPESASKAVLRVLQGRKAEKAATGQ